jgi:hypothetical protein
MKESRFQSLFKHCRQCRLVDSKNSGYAKKTKITLTENMYAKFMPEESSQLKVHQVQSLMRCRWKIKSSDTGGRKQKVPTRAILIFCGRVQPMLFSYKRSSLMKSQAVSVKMKKATKSLSMLQYMKFCNKGIMKFKKQSIFISKTPITLFLSPNMSFFLNMLFIKIHWHWLLILRNTLNICAFTNIWFSAITFYGLPHPINRWGSTASTNDCAV